MATTAHPDFGIDANIQEATHVFHASSTEAQNSQELVDGIREVFRGGDPENEREELVVSGDEHAVVLDGSSAPDLDSGRRRATGQNPGLSALHHQLLHDAVDAQHLEELIHHGVVPICESRGKEL